MALPKEPRQKMINMMYLVLTALLALNVSSEILNAFKTVNNSINTSNKLISEKNEVTYQSFKDKLDDDQTKAKAAIWKPKADAVQKLSADMFSYIETIKQELKKESDLQVNSEGVETFKEDNLDAAIRLMDEKGKGKELYEKLLKFRTDVISVLKPEEFADNPSFQAQLKKDIEALKKSIPVNVEVPKGQSGKEYSNDAKGWTTNYFHMTPTIAGLTILSKLQNDVKNSEAQLVDYCHEQIGKVKLVYDAFEAIAQANRTYAMPGEPIEITAGVGAFSEAAKPTIVINGQNVPLTGGKAIYKTTANGAGDHSIAVKISYVKPDGTVETKNETVKYTVGVPSGASVFLEKMNVLYMGVENPVTISGGSVGSEKVNVSFSGGSFKKAGGDRYIFSPTKQGMAEIVVNADNKRYTFPMRCKRLPDPTAMVGTSKGGGIPTATFKAMGGMIAKLVESDFEAPFQVVSYVLGANGGSFQTYQQSNNEGPRWSGGAKAIIDRATPGSSIFFDQIRVKGPDGQVRELPGIFFNLR